jgi:hypothetical protein
MLLLAVEILDCEPVHRKSAIRRHPLLHRRQRNLQQLGIEPCARLARLREEDLDFLTPCVDRVIALVFVVFQRREVPHLVGQLSDVVGESHGRQQGVRSLRERSLQRRVCADLRVELVEGLLPLRPVREDMCEIPFVPIGDIGTVAQLRRGWTFCGRGHVDDHTRRRTSCSASIREERSWIIHVRG